MKQGKVIPIDRIVEGNITNNRFPLPLETDTNSIGSPSSFVTVGEVGPRQVVVVVAISPRPFVSATFQSTIISNNKTIKVALPGTAELLSCLLYVYVTYHVLTNYVNKLISPPL